MTSNKKSAILILLIFIFVMMNYYKDKNVRFEDKLQYVLDQGIKQYTVPGVSAAVMVGDEFRWIGTSGVSHDTVSMKSKMVFAIGSITKNFVATLTLKLIEEGYLSLDDPISKWLPTYPHINNQITIRQLLNHTSGIYMFWSNQKIWDDLKKDRTKIWTPEEILTYIKAPYFEPNKGFRYSNTNYLLLAMIIVKVTDTTLSSNLNKYFWVPYEINSAQLSIEEKITANQAHVFGDNFNNDGSYQDVTFFPRDSHESITYGSSGIFITAEDLCKWSQLLFEGHILNKQSIEEMLMFTNFVPHSNMSGYGLGVQLYIKPLVNGKIAYGHSGANIGTSSTMIYLPEQRICIAIMINNMNHECTEYILKNIVKTSLKELNDYSIISIYNKSFYVSCICLCFSFLIINVIRIVKKRKKNQI